MLHDYISENKYLGWEEFTTASNNINPDQESLTQASDVYNFGVIMWTISSEKIPSENSSSSRDLVTNIREKPVIDTPEAYIELYQRCCEQNSKSRPTIQGICDQLEIMLLEKTFNFSDKVNFLNVIDAILSVITSFLIDFQRKIT
ncbi:kinase-like protein [Gigaspora margarita]|uniref:Kinase-like protein n=1 Tax=Gigaspora margarita TaxID=4874 RepID=A0A8H4EL35_GIGMA|nr:kinase-like protein [Gigaspora margarita]